MLNIVISSLDVISTLFDLYINNVLCFDFILPILLKFFVSDLVLYLSKLFRLSINFNISILMEKWAKWTCAVKGGKPLTL